jgi:FkbM family methyltransferase
MLITRTWRKLARLWGPRLAGAPKQFRLRRADDLIIDVGGHNGRDAEFYLRKGFRVVSIEANPQLAAGIASRLRDYLASGWLTLLPYGIHERAGEFTFYQNLDKDDWSSFIPEIGTRNNTRYREIRVPCVPFAAVLERFGVPYYLKCDIEGNDVHVLRALLDLRATPKYVSVESHTLDYLAYLRALGYGKFKIVNQALLGNVRCPDPPKEGKYVDYQFDGHTSGPFGEESPGEWGTFSEVASAFLHLKEGQGWFDFHAKL